MLSENNSITQFLADDHGRIIARFQEFRSSAANGLEAREETLSYFISTLERHARYVEGVVVPTIKERLEEETLNMVTELMKDGHGGVDELVNKIQKRLQAGDADLESLEDRLIAAMNEHFAKEEKVLYPIFDEHLSQKEKEGLIRRMEKMDIESEE